MRFAVVVVVAGLSLIGCGTPDSNDKVRAQATLNKFVDGLMKQDPALLKSILSKGELEAAARRGPDLDRAVLAEFAGQREGLIMNFGEEWLSRNQIPVSEIIPRGENLLAVTLEIHGATDPKPVFFEMDGDELKFAGITPPLSVAQKAVAGVNNSTWNAWHFHNYNASYVATIDCTKDASFNKLYFVLPANGGDANPGNCYSGTLWSGARWTQVELGSTPLGNAVSWNCLYQAIGVDAFMDANGALNCSRCANGACVW